MRVLISRSKDGEWGARAAEKLGYRTIRGSSSSGGGPALKNLARDLRENGGWVAVVVDGPRGPRRAAKPGAAWLGGFTGLPTWCASAISSRDFTLNSWDRCRIPLPFSRIQLRVSELPAGQEGSKPLNLLAQGRIHDSMNENEDRLREFLSLCD